MGRRDLFPEIRWWKVKVEVDVVIFEMKRQIAKSVDMPWPFIS